MSAIIEMKASKTEEIDIYSPEHLALAEFLECDPGDISEESYDYYGLQVFSGCGGEYAIGTDDKAQDAATEYCRETAWAFDPYYLASWTGMPIEVFQALQDKCESANEAVLKIIGPNDFMDFAEDALSADGRGHFLASYDGEENESGDYFIYRTN